MFSFAVIVWLVCRRLWLTDSCTLLDKRFLCKFEKLSLQTKIVHSASDTCFTGEKAFPFNQSDIISVAILSSVAALISNWATPSLFARANECCV